MVVVNTPAVDVERMLQERRTHQEVFDARSFANKYRLAIGQINTESNVRVWFGKVSRQIPTTDLMTLLRECKEHFDKEYLELGKIHPLDFKFFIAVLHRFGHRRHTNLDIKELLYLKRLAHGKFSPSEPIDPEEGKDKKRLSRLRRQLNISRVQKKQAEDRKGSPRKPGCNYLDPRSGVRCGAPCEGSLCEAHKDKIPPVNGHGSLFYAVNRKESNPYRK